MKSSLLARSLSFEIKDWTRLGGRQVDSMCEAKPEALDQWRDATGRFASGLQARPGLMSVPMGIALHAVAQRQTESVSHSPAGEPAQGGRLAWSDWWQTRQRVASGGLSVQEVTQASLRKLEQVHMATGACVELMNASAMRQARACDERIAAGQEPGALSGMPLAHKDLLLRSGGKVAYGMARDRGVADTDATVLRRLDAAGALHLARLHMTEIAFDPAGVNEMAGHCRNPWSSHHIAGGSSSGSAAAVAAGAVAGAIGSDTGGSIRIPSILCGVTGLKPTFGLVSRAGAMTLSQTNDHLGPIARSARDCALLLQVLAGADEMDAGSVPAPHKVEYTAGLGSSVRGVRIGILQSCFTRNLHSDVESALQAGIEKFRQMGAEIREVPEFAYDDLNALATMIIRAEATAMFGRLSGSPGSPLGAFTRARLDEGVAIPASMYLNALGMRGPVLIHFVESVMAEVDVLIAPVFAHATPRIDEFDQLDARSQFLRQELTRLTRPFNFLGLPSLALPGGYVETADGARLPTGFQLIGRPYSEPLLLRLGNAFQMASACDGDQLPKPNELPWC